MIPDNTTDRNTKKTHTDRFDTIVRCPHDQENPYSMISNALIRDNNISPECRMLLISLLSNCNGWQINITDLRAKFKKHWGKDKIYRFLNEAIEAGYITREIANRPNPKGGSLLGYRYIISERPKFKKDNRYPENQYAENQDAGFKDTNNNIYKKEQININTPASPYDASASRDESFFSSQDQSKPDSYSPEVLRVYDAICKKLLHLKPDYKLPHKPTVCKTIRMMLATDKRDPERLLAVLDQMLQDKFWKNKMFSKNPATTLRNRFDEFDAGLGNIATIQERNYIPDVYANIDMTARFAEAAEKGRRQHEEYLKSFQEEVSYE